MSETPIHAEDGSPLREEAKTERPFTHPLSAYENQKVDNEGADPEESEQVDPRMAVIQAAADRADEDRTIAPGTRQEDMPMGEPVPDEGLQSREAIESAEEQDVPEEEVDTDVDPLSEFIVQGENGEPLFRTVVNGEERYIPLDRARAQLQKHESADQRLQTAAQIQQTLEQREQAIAAREEQFSSSAQKVNQPEPEEVSGLTDEELAAKAADLVNGLFTGSEEDAAAKMVDLLKEVKGAATATPTIDPDEIAKQAAAAARQALSEDELQKDVKAGYKKFAEDYPDVVEDDMLFGMADSMTDAIAREHPEWKPSTVMLEAGKRVREWVESKTGKKTPEQSEAPNVDRQDRKRKLRPMPTARQGVEPQDPEVQPDTPQTYMEEIRAARGQAV